MFSKEYVQFTREYYVCLSEVERCELKGIEMLDTSSGKEIILVKITLQCKFIFNILYLFVIFYFIWSLVLILY